jgi:hypothetical protein
MLIADLAFWPGQQRSERPDDVEVSCAFAPGQPNGKAVQTQLLVSQLLDHDPLQPFAERGKGADGTSMRESSTVSMQRPTALRSSDQLIAATVPRDPE